MNRARVVSASLLLLALGPPVSAATLTVCDSGCDHTSIQAAVDAAVAGDTIALQAQTYTEFAISVDKDLTIQGVSQTDTIVQASATKNDGSVKDPVFLIEAAKSVAFEDLTIQNGRAYWGGQEYRGGGLYSEGDVTMTNVTLKDNVAAQDGGGLYSEGGAMLTNVMFDGNISSQHGGGMATDFSYGTVCSISLNTVTFDSNEAQRDGGGLYVGYNCQVVGLLTDSTFSNNISGDRGGGLYVASSSINLTGVTFDANSAPNKGGGMFVGNFGDPVETMLTDSTFSNNTSSTDDGGGLASEGGRDLILSNVTFDANVSDSHGGGLWSGSDNVISLNTVTFSGNTASTSGGGVALYNPREAVSLNDVTFDGNEATNSYGGGLDLDNASNEVTTTLANVTFSGNHAQEEGGGMRSDYVRGPLVLTNVTFSGNTTNYIGGGWYSSSVDDAAVANVRFSNNTAGDSGGGWGGYATTAALVNVTFNGNTVPHNGVGGGIYTQGASNTTLENVVMWGNLQGTVPVSIHRWFDNGSMSIGHSLFGENDLCRNNSCGSGLGVLGITDLGGNIVGEDPLFADTDGRLGEGSPAVDTGNNDALPADEFDLDGDTDTVETLPVDLDGNPRIAADIVDMGAYEVLTPAEAVAALEDFVLTLEAPESVISVLTSVLDGADEFLSDDNLANDTSAVGRLQSLANYVAAQQGKKINTEDAAMLIDAVGSIIDSLESQ